MKITIQVWETLGNNLIEEIVVDLDSEGGEALLIKTVRWAKSKGYELLL